MAGLKTKWDTCTWCHLGGHDASQCTRLTDSVKKGQIRAIKFHKKITTGGRVCGYCAEDNHSSPKCPKRFDDAKLMYASQKQVADAAFAWLHEIGFGPGAMLSAMATESSWRARGKDQKMVIIEDFTNRTVTSFLNELMYGTTRNWYQVTAVDTACEKIRRIYLPFHPVYSPRPTSMKVEIVHKATPEEIDKLKQHVECYASPLLEYSSAEEFFDAGFRFEAGQSKMVKVKRIHN